ncbi:MAG: hypothetical protein IT342_11090 [Candidatus Melainabacteria bacterium]|jgi:hypothetical protein|nr:hypothetical protein [Candidatus Melainabacteria bacterium]
MAEITADLKTAELLKLAADNHHKRITLSEDERKQVIALLKQKGAEELEYGQEIEFDTVRLVRRVTGAVGVYFS